VDSAKQSHTLPAAPRQEAPSLTYEAAGRPDELAIEATPAGAVITLPAVAISFHVKGLIVSALGVMVFAAFAIFGIARAFLRPSVPGHWFAAGVGLLVGALGLLLLRTASDHIVCIRRHRNGMPRRTRVLLTTEPVKQLPGGQRVVGSVLAIDVVRHHRADRQQGFMVRVIAATSWPIPLVGPLPEQLAHRVAADIRAALRLPAPPPPTH
jgi:hypothetical protein